MEFRSAALGVDSTSSRGQAALRRILQGNFMPDSTFTQGDFDTNAPIGISVFPQDISPVRNIRFSESKVTEVVSSHRSVEGDGNPSDSESREQRGTEEVFSRLGERSAGTAEKNAGNRQREWRDSSHLPGDFLYLTSDHVSPQAGATEFRPPAQEYSSRYGNNWGF